MSESGYAPLAGLYRGSVVGDVDPMQRSRVQVDVMTVGLSGVWAELAAPLDGDRVVAPSVGASVWVMFEDQQPEYPVVIGVLVP
jgi:hypothetical protein